MLLQPRLEPRTAQPVQNSYTGHDNNKYKTFVLALCKLERNCFNRNKIKLPYSGRMIQFFSFMTDRTHSSFGQFRSKAKVNYALLLSKPIYSI
jgi:hypothetical protein